MRYTFELRLLMVCELNLVSFCLEEVGIASNEYWWMEVVHPVVACSVIWIRFRCRLRYNHSRPLTLCLLSASQASSGRFVHSINLRGSAWTATFCEMTPVNPGQRVTCLRCPWTSYKRVRCFTRTDWARPSGSTGLFWNLRKTLLSKFVHRNRSLVLRIVDRPDVKRGHRP